MAEFTFEIADAEIERLAAIAASAAAKDLLAGREFGRDPGAGYRIIEQKALAHLSEAERAFARSEAKGVR